MVLVVVIFASCHSSQSGPSDGFADHSQSDRTASSPPAPAGESRTSDKPSFDSQATTIDDRDWFETITPSTGIEFAYRNGEQAQRMTLLETLGGGAAVIDFDRDGDLDLFVTGGGTIPSSGGQISGLPPSLWENLGNFQFRRVDHRAGLTDSRLYTHGCAVADYNRDGFADIVVAGFGGVMLYINLGDGTLTEVALESGLRAEGWCTALAWNDFDQDGYNDLLIARYVDWTLPTNKICQAPVERANQACGPLSYSPMSALLYRNCGDGSFEDVSVNQGITQQANGLGVVAADMNGDGRCELYLASDLTDNLYFVPSKTSGFQEMSQIVGLATNDIGSPEGSMGIAIADYDGNGLPDMLVTNFEGEDNSLYRNLGEGMFLHATNPAGLFGASRMRVGFGTMLTDFDGDGWPDIIVANGHVNAHGGRSGYRQLPQLFRNREGVRFEDVSSLGGSYFSQEHHGRGMVVADFNDDGAPDVVIVHQNDSVEILRNRQPPPHYVGVRLRGTTANAEAIGARVQVADGERMISQWVTSGVGYFSQSDYRMIFALQSEVETVTVSVHWPGGRHENFPSLSINRTHELVEGQGNSPAAQR